MKKSTFAYICDVLIASITWFIFGYMLYVSNAPTWIWAVFGVGIGITAERLNRNRKNNTNGRS